MKLATLFLSALLGGHSIFAKDPAPATTAQSWDWNAFPKSDRLLVAQLPAHVGPARTETIRSVALGKLRLAPDLDLSQPIEAGTVWGRIEADDAELEAVAIKRLEEEILRREQRYVELEKPGQIAQLEKDLRAADDAAAAASFAERQPALFKGERPVLDPSLRPALPASQLREAAASLRSKKDRVLAGDPQLDPPDLQSLRGERVRRLATRDARERQLKLVQPFTGRLLLADKRDGRQVAAGEALAIAVDPATVCIKIRATSSLLLALEASSLQAEFAVPGGTTMTAPYTAGGFDPAAEGAAILLFETPSTKAVFETLGATGADLPARVFTKLPTPVCIVPKLALAKYDPKEALASGWRDGVSKLFPTAAFLAEGRSAVAIQAPVQK